MSETDLPKTLDVVDILKSLPHRYPFLLLDRVVEFQPGQRLVALKNVTINEPFFQGHFPGEPVMPGVLILEAMAQAGGLLVGLSRPGEAGLCMLASVRNARFRRPVRPGDQLRLEVTAAASVKSVAPRVEARTTVNELVVAEADIMFAFGSVRR
ncbi:3-hydroxyacyl-ACP dehydratase FabZ [Candidatus Sumerlaeota bacterium]|nr:3-hydroxyacyl-ACP dehydratase FabZ [Candidatus Sumerlaeota bacterium]